MDRLEELGVKTRSIHCTSEIFRIFEFVVDGRGLGYGSDLLSPMFAANPEVVTIPLEDAWFRFGISFLSTHQPTKDEQAFIDYCAHYARSLK